MPKARQGVLDLSAWDFERHGPVRLDGDWEVRWDSLLPPGALNAAPETDVASIPGPWSQTKPGSGVTNATGSATLRLVVLPNPGMRQLALRLTSISAAYSLWANGRLLAHSGQPGQDAGAETARPSSVVIPLHDMQTTQDSTSPLELVLLVSNQHFREGGVLSSLWLGPESTLLAQHARDLGIAMFLAGVLFIMGVYHVALYFFRRSNPSTLLFALYCLLWLGNYTCSESSGWVVYSFLPSLPSLGLEHFALACLFLSVPVGYSLFISLYPLEFSRLLQRYSWATGVGFAALAAFGPTLALTTVLPLYYLSTFCLILYCFARLHRAWRRGREGAAFIFVGFLLLGLVGMHDMLTDLRFISSPPMLAPGMLVFILSQALALSKRLSRAFASVETLSEQLEYKNLSLESEIAERNRLERAVLSISDEERRRMSLSLHDGICQLLTAARLRCSVLTLSGQDKGGDLGKLSELLDELVEQAYDLSRGLWPLEHGHAGVGPSLQDMVQRFSSSSGVPIVFRKSIGCQACANPNVTQLYRIAQEALANAIKHAKPGSISVSLECRAGGLVALIVRDDGIGRGKAKKSKGGLGMGIMAHRARLIGGELDIQDAEDGGTVVYCAFPCETTSQAQAGENNE